MTWVFSKFVVSSICYFCFQRSTVDELVIHPLSHLVQMFEGPNKVIVKRFDKLLDYDSQFRKAKDGEKVNTTVFINCGVQLYNIPLS